MKTDVLAAICAHTLPAKTCPVPLPSPFPPYIPQSPADFEARTQSDAIIANVLSLSPSLHTHIHTSTYAHIHTPPQDPEIARTYAQEIMEEARPLFNTLVSRFCTFTLAEKRGCANLIMILARNIICFPPKDKNFAGNSGDVARENEDAYVRKAENLSVILTMNEVITGLLESNDSTLVCMRVCVMAFMHVVCMYVYVSFNIDTCVCIMYVSLILTNINAHVSIYVCIYQLF
jgi:hypothetical protein